jgi:hypothetical protein
LIRQEDIEVFQLQLETLRAELAEAVEQLNGEYAALQVAAQDRLGRLFNQHDYPPSLVGLFAVDWEFPAVEPPSYLRQLNPQLYQAECRRVAAKFDEAVQLAEAAFASELANLVSHLQQKLAGHDDGKPKVFRDSAVDNLREFFERFQKLNLGSSDQLDQLVDEAQSILTGVQPQQLRDSTSLRSQVAGQLGGVQQALDQLLVERPRRNILRRPK